MPFAKYGIFLHKNVASQNGSVCHLVYYHSLREQGIGSVTASIIII